MHEHALEMIVDAEVPAVWRTLHPRRPPGAEVPFGGRQAAVVPCRGWHRVEEVGEGRTRLTFWES